MNRKTLLYLSTVCFALVAIPAVVWAADRDIRTTIKIQGMHCQGCANKLAAKLKEVPGVASAKVHAKEGLATVNPIAGTKLHSPRAQWEAVENAAYKPIRLAGPLGVFTEKPRN